MPLAARRMMATCLAGLLAASAGCSHKLTPVTRPTSRPEIRLESARLESPASDSYSVLARWVAGSAGRPLSHYVYAIDPVSVDDVDDSWVRTTETRLVLAFPRTGKTASSGRPHVFVVRAVDDRGQMSDPEWFAIGEENIPPLVVIVSPPPSPLVTHYLTPSARFTWAGTDADGQSTTTPVRYVFRLFGRQNPDFPLIPDFVSFAVTYPDSLRALYAPDFPGWASVGGDTTSFQYQNLTPASTYLFAVTGFDEAGDYDPIFSTGKNLLRFNVTFAGVGGPVLTLFNEVFHYTYPNGGWVNDPTRWIPVEVPAGLPVRVNWTGTPSVGTAIAWYRWALDAADLSDETPRTDEQYDWSRWSARSSLTTSATVGPFALPGSHFLYVEAEDHNGLRSLGIVNLSVRTATFSKPLLFVDDTRLTPDRKSGATILPPVGPWPTAAELDSFLFARGGFPWKAYPSGTLSTPGIFNGYDFDTIGTRGLSADGSLPLSLLGNYQHIVWYTDEAGAAYTNPPLSPSSPITALRAMSAPGRSSALAAFLQQGGKLWLCGGGAAYATLVTWNRGGTSPSEYTSAQNELVPGRFMYDWAHWREGVQMLPAVVARKFGTTSFGIGDNRPGRHWPPAPPPPTPPAPPSYALLPASLDPKSPASDPPPPLRNPDSFFYRSSYAAEHIHLPTYIREDFDDDPFLEAEYSTLDTLYITSGGTAPANSPVMTYYHGRDNQPVVFSGFNLWFWRRSQCIGLVDWVLQSVWGLPRDATAPREPTVTPQTALRTPSPRPAGAPSGTP